jgi:hypothetical protein
MLALYLILAVLAVARVTRLLTEDRLALAYRRWVTRRYGEESLRAYLAHCPWCTSIYVALPVMPATVFVAAPTLGLVAKIAMSLLAVGAASMLTGLLLNGKA